MAKSQRLRWRDFRDVYRLLGECRELGQDPLAWRDRMAKGLTQLVRGQITMYTESVRVGPPGQKHWLALRQLLDQGWATESDRQAVYRIYDEGRPDIEGSCFTEEFGKSRAARTVATREQLLEDGPWYSGRFFNEFMRPARLDDAIALKFCEGNEIRLLILQRALNDQQFERRQLRIVRAFAIELQNHFGRSLSRRDGFSVQDLSPRQRQVLLFLLDGDSIKQVALRIGTSRHTVQDYVKALYQRFDVHSRGELVARCSPLRGALIQYFARDV